MKLHIFRHLAAGTAAAAIFAVTGSALAQETYSGYFADGYEYRFRMNPAVGNDSTSFVAIPMLGNINAAMRGNLHVTDLIYNRNGRTVLFTNPGVSANTVMGNLDPLNKVGADFNFTVLAFGFKAWGGYNTFSLNARGSFNTSIPKDMFRLFKEGFENKTYDIKDVRARARAFAEIALGHSRDINSQWRVGGTLKFLLGAGDIDAHLSQARLTLGTDNWTIQSNASMRASVKGIKYKVDEDGYVDGMEVKGAGINGFGMALDLGAVYTLNPDWQFSASLLDLGFINWANDVLATTNGQTFETDKYTFNPDDNADNSFNNEWDKMKDDLENLYHLEDVGDRGARTTALAATLNLAARYTFPLYRKLNFGLVNTTHINGKYTWTDFRLSANVAPVKMFSASANLAVGTYGVGFGWMLNYHYTGFGIFLGMDNTLGKVSKQFVPLNSNASLNFGMNILF